MKSLIIFAFCALFAIQPQAQHTTPSPDSFTIDSDVTVGGIRTIEATPSRLVCPKKITIKIKVAGNIIEDVDYVGGCPGNLKAVKALTKGQTVDQVIGKLDGIDCGKRGTSCTDQLCRILKKAMKK